MDPEERANFLLYLHVAACLVVCTRMGWISSVKCPPGEHLSCYPPECCRQPSPLHLLAISGCSTSLLPAEDWCACRQALPNADLGKLLAREPLMLTVDVQACLQEVRRLLPDIDPVAYLTNNPEGVLDMEQSALPSALDGNLVE